MIKTKKMFTIFNLVQYKCINLKQTRRDAALALVWHKAEYRQLLQYYLITFYPIFCVCLYEHTLCLWSLSAPISFSFLLSHLLYLRIVSFCLLTNHFFLFAWIVSLFFVCRGAIASHLFFFFNNLSCLLLLSLMCISLSALIPVLFLSLEILHD